MGILSTTVSLLCNILWMMSCLPGWILFLAALHFPRFSQERILRRILRRNRQCAFGKLHNFEKIHSADAFSRQVPLSEYSDHASAIDSIQREIPFSLCSEPVHLLEPTSGSSGRPKLIPYTVSLRREFHAAIGPWIAGLYLAHPKLLLGKQYWCISPNTAVPDTDGRLDKIRIGFADDTEYLGLVARWTARNLLVTPPEISRITNPETFMHLTLLHLLREPDLRLISIWHPSFLTNLLDAMPRHLPVILDEIRTGRLVQTPGIPDDVHEKLRKGLKPNADRADMISSVAQGPGPTDFRKVWPHLAVISCWTDGHSEPWLGRIRQRFPGVAIQSKGLVATEGIVSLPFGSLRPCAVGSHFLEFVDAKHGFVRRLWELEEGGEYSIVLTTGGGLWRYRLHDLVRVTGYCGKTPCLEFLGKDNAVSDLVGEKIDERHAAEAIVRAEKKTGITPLFSMLVPVIYQDGTCGYKIHMEMEYGNEMHKSYDAFAAAVELELRRNYHYAHARNIGQLKAAVACVVNGAEALYRKECEQRGMKSGNVKYQALKTCVSGLNKKDVHESRDVKIQ